MNETQQHASSWVEIYQRRICLTPTPTTTINHHQQICDQLQPLRSKSDDGVLIRLAELSREKKTGLRFETDDQQNRD